MLTSLLVGLCTLFASAVPGSFAGMEAPKAPSSVLAPSPISAHQPPNSPQGPKGASPQGNNGGCPQGGTSGRLPGVTGGRPQGGGWAPHPVVAPGHRLRLTQWSDIHYGNPEHSQASWEAVCKQTLASPPDALVVSGDQVDNKCSEAEFVQHSEAFLTQLRQRFEALKRPVVLALGNNDLPRNYQTDPQGLGQTLARYHRLLGPWCYLDALGNGVYPREIGGTVWITLNTLFFSPLNHAPQASRQADQTLSWLEARLAQIKPAKPVMLVVHIPPTVDYYDHKSSWTPAAVTRFSEILARYPGKVVVLGGHYHRNEVHALGLPGGRAVPVFLAGSLCTKYGVHPNWRTYQVDESQQGDVDAIAYNIRYPLENGAVSPWVVEHPCDALALRTWVEHLAAGSNWYGRYVQDLWSRQDGSDHRSRSADDYRRLLQEVWTTPACP